MHHPLGDHFKLQINLPFLSLVPTKESLWCYIDLLSGTMATCFAVWYVALTIMSYKLLWSIFHPPWGKVSLHINLIYPDNFPNICIWYGLVDFYALIPFTYIFWSHNIVWNTFLSWYVIKLSLILSKWNTFFVFWYTKVITFGQCSQFRI